MFSNWFSGDDLERYRTSPHKQRIDAIASSLLRLQYASEVIRQHLHEWLRFSGTLDAKETTPLPAPSAEAVRQYVADRVAGCSASRSRALRASVRILLEADEQGRFRRRVGCPPFTSAWFGPILTRYLQFVRGHRGLARKRQGSTSNFGRAHATLTLARNSVGPLCRDYRRQEIRLVPGRVVHPVFGLQPLRLAVVVAAGIQVALKAREVAARHLESDAVARTEVVGRGLEVDDQLVEAARFHPHLLAVPLAVARPKDPLLHVEGFAVRIDVHQLAVKSVSLEEDETCSTVCRGPVTSTPSFRGGVE